MTDSFDQDFIRFSRDRLLPLVDVVNARRRTGLVVSVATALALFGLFAFAVYLFLAPYQKLLGEYDITYWPLLVLAPASLAMIGFCLVYILYLRRVVGEFRESLVKRMAEFIDAGLVHESDRGIADKELRDSLFFAPSWRLTSGRDHFRGRAGVASVDFAELRAVSPGEGGGGPLAGMIFIARFPRNFRSFALVLPASAPASVSGVEDALRERAVAAGTLVRLDDPEADRQLLAPSGEQAFAESLLSPDARRRLSRLRGDRGVGLYLSCIGGTLYAALLSEHKGAEQAGVFEGFDIERCREFCRDAGFCMDLAREIGGRSDLWRDA